MLMLDTLPLMRGIEYPVAVALAKATRRTNHADRPEGRDRTFRIADA